MVIWEAVGCDNEVDNIYMFKTTFQYKEQKFKVEPALSKTN